MKNKQNYFVIAVILSTFVLGAFAIFKLFGSNLHNLSGSNSSNSKIVFRAPDTTIRPATGDYTYENTANNFSTSFKAKASDPDGINFSNSIGSISFYTPIAQQFGQLNSDYTPVSSGSSITYPNIFPQMDLRYTISTTMLLEEFIVKDKSTANQITQIEQFAKTDLDYQQNADSSITFTKNGKTAFSLPAPVLYELGNKNNRSNGIKYEIKKDGDQLIITKVITPEGMAWINDSNRKYPIVIDLVIDNADTAGNWVSSNSTNLAVSQDTVVKEEGTGSVKLTAKGVGLGTGADGAGSVPASTTKTLDTQSISGRSCADAVNYNVATGGLGTPGQATLTTTPATGCLSAGNEVLLINLQGTNTAFVNVGNYETLFVQSVSSNVVTFTANKTKYYGDNVSDDSNIGTATTNQRVMLQRIPQYTSVTVSSTGTLTTTAWNGTKGGVLFFRATGSVSVTGTILGDALGYAGGLTWVTSGSNNYGGMGGESFCGLGGQTYGGSGAAGAGPNGNGYCGGGAPSSGTGSASQGGAGAGGKDGSSGGGGGGNGTGGYSSNNNAQAGSNTSLNGTGNYAGGGGSYTATGKLFFGSGGGHGGSTYGFGAAGAAGGAGGGIIFISANSITDSSLISANGHVGGDNSSVNMAAGGGGAGGTITLSANTLTLGTSLVTATGGNGGTIGSSSTSNGGKGGSGVVYVNYVTSLSGTTSPGATTNSDPTALNDTVTITKGAINLSSVKYLTFWVYSSRTGSFMTFQFGQTVSSEQTHAFTVSTANTWQQVTWDISGIAGGSRTAVTKFAFLVTNADNNFTLNFDNILSNTSPATPSLDLPTNAATAQILSPVLKTTATDADSDHIKYKIKLCTNSGMTADCQTFDQTSSQTGWSGQNADGSTTYTSGTQGVYTVQTPLSSGVTYYWESWAIDPAGSNNWSSTQGSPYSFTVIIIPTIPTLDYPAESASGVSPLPDLKTTSTDAAGISYLRYKIKLCTNFAMTTGCQTFDQTSSQTGWSGQNAQSSTAYTSGTQAVYTVQSALTTNISYYWQSWAIAPGDSNVWSYTQATPNIFTTGSIPLSGYNCLLVKAADNSSIQINWQNNSNDENGIAIQKNTDSAGYVDLTTLAAHSTTYTDSSVGSGHTYQYRVASYYTGPIYSNWCETSTLNLQHSDFMFQGIQIH